MIENQTCKEPSNGTVLDVERWGKGFQQCVRAMEIGGTAQEAVNELEQLAKGEEPMALRQLAFIALAATKALNQQVVCWTDDALLQSALADVTRDRLDWPVLVNEQWMASDDKIKHWREMARRLFEKIGLSTNRPDKCEIGSKMQLPIEDDLAPLMPAKASAAKKDASVEQVAGNPISRRKRDVDEEKRRNDTVRTWIRNIDDAFQEYQRKRVEAEHIKGQRIQGEQRLAEAKKLLAEAQTAKRGVKQIRELKNAVAGCEEFLAFPIDEYQGRCLLTSKPKEWLREVWNVKDEDLDEYAAAMSLPRFPLSSDAWWRDVFRPYAMRHLEELAGWNRVLVANPEQGTQKLLARVKAAIDAFAKARIK